LTNNIGPSYSTNARPSINYEGSFELNANLYAQPEAYSYAIRNYVNNWRAEPSPLPGYVNKLDYIQALLRQSGISKDKSPRGIIGNDDAKAMQDISKIAIQNNLYFLDTLQELYKNRNAGNAAISKQVATSIRLIDPTDAKASLSDAYYKTFGAFPSQGQINKYMDLYNAEATRQNTKTITTTTGGTVSTSKSITQGEGFTEKEQQQFLADYLVKNYQMTSSEILGGQAKTLYDAIVNTYAANYLDEPDFARVSSVIKDVLSSSDDEVASQKLDVFLQEGRKIAAKQWLGLEKELLAGENIATYTSPLAKSLTKLFGRTVDVSDPLIKKAINFKDEKGVYRMMNDIELNQAAEADPRFATSSTAVNKSISLADTIASKLGQ
jgi:hypothetical protein